MTFAEFTEIGNRKINEDAVAVKEKDGKLFCVLCDGLGGHGRGDEASQFVTAKLISMFEEDDDFENHFAEALEETQQGLLAEQKKKAAKFEMKTTVTMLIITKDIIRWAHIGDSRVYMFKKGKYKKRTLDHSVPQMLVMAKEIKESEIRNHPDRNKLLRVMGVEWGHSKYEVSKPMRRKDSYAFLLCSDGFWELIDEDAMSSKLKSSSNAEEWINSMAETVLEAGKDKKMDNYSAVAVIL